MELNRDSLNKNSDHLQRLDSTTSTQAPLIEKDGRPPKISFWSWWSKLEFFALLSLIALNFVLILIILPLVTSIFTKLNMIALDINGIKGTNEILSKEQRDVKLKMISISDIQQQIQGKVQIF